MGNICNVIPLQETNVDDKANAKALCVDLSGNPITFEADSAIAQKLSVDLEPIQDLHGYANPWVGGAGKNKLPMVLANIKSLNTTGTWNGNSYTLGGVTIEVLMDSDSNIIGFKATGTASETVVFNINAYTANTGDILNGCPSGGSNSTYKLYIRGGSTNDYGDGATVSSSDVGVSHNIAIAIYSGYSIPSDGLLFKPMVRLSTESDATFAPYTNDCPISERTETDVRTEGKNLCDWKVNTTQNKLSINLKAGTYVISANGTLSSGNWYLRFSDSNGEYSYSASEVGLTGYTKASSGWYYGDASAQYVSFIVPSGCTLVEIGKLNSNGTIYAQLEHGTTPTAYTPYVAPHTATLSFGQTVYGGHVDFKTGKVTVNRGTVTVDDTWVYGTYGGKNYLVKNPSDNKRYGTSPHIDPICNMLPFGGYGGSSIFVDGNFYQTSTTTSADLYIQDSRYTSKESFVSAYSGCMICYELATPIELQLTPAELELLQGYNYISADGNINISLVPENVIDYVMGQIISAMGTNESGRTTASRAYSAKEYFYKDGKMYKCLTSIASGATFTVGTNCAETTIFAELTALNA